MSTRKQIITSAGSVPKPRNVRIFLVALVAAVGGFVFGYDIMILSSAILFMREFFGMSARQEGFAMTSAVWGIFLGLLIAGPLSDRMGRKKPLFISALLFAISAIGSAVAGSLLVWNEFRILGGIGAGVASVISPLYISEIAPAAIRGRLVSMNQMAIVLSVVAASVVGYFLATVHDEWRWMFASELLPVIILAFAVWFIPESPRWLVGVGAKQEALRVLDWAGGAEHAQTEMRAIEETLNKETGKLSELWQPGLRMALLVAIAVAAFQQLTGASTLLFYGPTIFKSAGIVKDTSAIGISIILNTLTVFFTVVSLWLVDNIGRRPLLLGGALVMCVGQILMGILFQFRLPASYALVFMIVSVGAYTASFAPLGWLIMSEVFPTRIRARAMAVTALVLQLSSLAANGFFPVVRNYSERTFGSAGPTFWLFAAICLLAFVFCLKMVPETKGRTLEEISSSWLKKR